jgi:hypothetical protein
MITARLKIQFIIWSHISSLPGKNFFYFLLVKAKFTIYLVKLATLTDKLVHESASSNVIIKATIN